MTRQEFEDQAQALVGRILIGIRYHEIAYPDGEPMWNSDTRFDSVDFGVELAMEGGDIFEITWGSEFIQYNISIRYNTADETRGMRTWDVSQTSRWKVLIGQRIVQVKSFWSWWQQTSPTIQERRYYPQDLEVVFDSGMVVYLSAFEARADDFRAGMMDNITVFFGAEVAKEFKIGPYAVDHDE